MISGFINSAGEAVVSVRIRGKAAITLDVEAVVDTAFSDYLTLPAGLLAILEVEQSDSMPVQLADGSVSLVPRYEARLNWDGEIRQIFIQVAETTPLLGLKLLSQYSLYAEFAPDGEVRLEPL